MSVKPNQTNKQTNDAITVKTTNGNGTNYNFGLVCGMHLLNPEYSNKKAHSFVNSESKVAAAPVERVKI